MEKSATLAHTFAQTPLPRRPPRPHTRRAAGGGRRNEPRSGGGVRAAGAAVSADAPAPPLPSPPPASKPHPRARQSFARLTTRAAPPGPISRRSACGPPWPAAAKRGADQGRAATRGSPVLKQGIKRRKKGIERGEGKSEGGGGGWGGCRLAAARRSSGPGPSPSPQLQPPPPPPPPPSRSGMRIVGE